MENPQQSLIEPFDNKAVELGLDGEQMDELRKTLRMIIKQTRQDTLRQVLDNHKVYIADLDETGILVEDIKRKAKELWGLDLTNLN